MAKLTKYFESKIGKKISKKYVTGVKRFGETYARRFDIEIIYIVNDIVNVNMKYQDITPDGSLSADNTGDLGDFNIALNACGGIEEFYKKAVMKADPNFFSYYSKIKELA